jgi:hypothetical protein
MFARLLRRAIALPARLHNRFEVRRARTERGQSFVEFALVLPMLLVLLLGIADFGRVFSAGITVEALSRNAAEATAQEYLQWRRAAGGSEPAAAYYTLALAKASAVACSEAKTLPNFVGTASTCSMPITGACIHDEWGDHCGSLGATAPSECSSLTAWPPTLADQPGGLPYVQVKACYRFTTLMNISALHLPFSSSLTIGDIWLQKTRSFTVADY